MGDSVSVSSSSVIKLHNGRWAKDCPSCGEQQDYLRKNYAEASLREGKYCKKCSNSTTENSHRGWHRGVRISWYNRFKINAALREIPWEIDMDYVADVYAAQEAKCALTGWSVVFPEIGHPQKADCSIDRINSDLGYVKGNVQLVNKRVNMMKQAYSQQEFMDVCLAVADNHNKQSGN